MTDPAGKSAATSEYGKGAALLSVGIGVTGLVTFAFFFLAAHTLDKFEYGQVSLLWSAVFIVVSVLYRPIEQLLARTVAEHHAHGEPLGKTLRVAASIQLGLGIVFAAAALAFRSRLEDDLFSGNTSLYWIMFASVLAYAASYFARGLLAGKKRFGLYAALVFVEANSRVVFALIVALGIASGQKTVALGILAAPLFSLFVVPLALARRARGGATEPPSVADSGISAIEDELDSTAAAEPREGMEFTLAHGTGFAAAAILIAICEQTFLNAGGLIVKATADNPAIGDALAGFVFNVILIARAPVQLFQSIQTSLLPHLAGLRAGGRGDAYRQSINVTLIAVAGFAAAVALVMLAAGPLVMELLFGSKFEYDRFGLVLVSVGMGFYLGGATLNQAALAAKRTAAAAGCWLLAAAAFVGWLVAPIVHDQVLRVEAGFFGASTLLFAGLLVLYMRSDTSTLMPIAEKDSK